MRRSAILGQRRPSIASWLLGYPQDALIDVEHALKIAREIGHSATLLYLLNFSTWPHIQCGNYAEANAVSTDDRTINPDLERFMAKRMDDAMTERRFVLVNFKYTNDVLGHIRFYEAGGTYAMRRGLARAAAKRELVAVQQPVDWIPPSILRPPDVLTESEGSLSQAAAERNVLVGNLVERDHEIIRRDPGSRNHSVVQGFQ